jgi:hypothetical protein
MDDEPISRWRRAVNFLNQVTTTMLFYMLVVGSSYGFGMLVSDLSTIWELYQEKQRLERGVFDELPQQGPGPKIMV